jgi:hypothetical protein
MLARDWFAVGWGIREKSKRIAARRTAGGRSIATALPAAEEKGHAGVREPAINRLAGLGCERWVDVTLLPACAGRARTKTTDPPQEIYLNGMAYINPPLFHRPLRPRLSFSGLEAPTFRSNISP